MLWGKPNLMLDICVTNSRGTVPLLDLEYLIYAEKRHQTFTSRPRNIFHDESLSGWATTADWGAGCQGCRSVVAHGKPLASAAHSLGAAEQAQPERRGSAVRGRRRRSLGLRGRQLRLRPHQLAARVPLPEYDGARPGHQPGTLECQQDM